MTIEKKTPICISDGTIAYNLCIRCIRQPYVKKPTRRKMKLPSRNKRKFVWAHQAYECTLHTSYGIASNESKCERNETYVGTMTSKIPSRCIVSMDVLSWDHIKYNGESIRCPETGEHGLPFQRNCETSTQEKRKRVITTILHAVCKHFELGRLHCTFADAFLAELRKRRLCTPNECSNKRHTNSRTQWKKSRFLKIV